MNDANRPPSLGDLREQLRLVFSSDASVDEWLDTPVRSLGWLSPREIASQPDGLEKVRNLVLRTIHGIPD